MDVLPKGACGGGEQIIIPLYHNVLPALWYAYKVKLYQNPTTQLTTTMHSIFAAQHLTDYPVFSCK